MNKKYYIKTFGCAMNYSDSERIASVLQKNGLRKTSSIDEADLVVFNTCGVRQMAEDRVYGQIHNIAKRGAQNVERKPLIILTGCLAHRKDVQRRLKNKVDLFFQMSDLKKFENWIIKSLLKIARLAEDGESRRENCKLKILTQENITNQEKIAYFSISPERNNKYQALVPIMTGCNNFCAYCVVPYARGREVSRPAKEIIKEVENLVKKGFKHIILLGQNVNSYHATYNMKHATKNMNFSQLLRKINNIPGKFWISFVSNHPKDVTDEMIETVAKCKKVCENFHLPIQAGNDEVLKNMNRKYTAKEYMKIVRKIRSAFRKYKPDSLYSITCDIIVGFPGETKKQFEDSAEVMKKAKYDMVYFGRFSPRPETAAWKMKDNVSKKEKERREKYLNEILKKTCHANNKKYVGKVVEVLIDRVKSDESDHVAGKNKIYFGKTRTGKNVKMTVSDRHPGLDPGSRSLVGKFNKVYPVKSSGSEVAVGKFNRVKITKANIWNLEGVIK